jgi:hypothetical protein
MEYDECVATVSCVAALRVMDYDECVATVTPLRGCTA